MHIYYIIYILGILLGKSIPLFICMELNFLCKSSVALLHLVSFAVIVFATVFFMGLIFRCFQKDKNQSWMGLVEQNENAAREVFLKNWEEVKLS